MRYILFDDHNRSLLFPFTHTRPIAHIRCGIRRIYEKWEDWMQAPASWITADYLKEVFEVATDGAALYIYAGLLPNEKIVAAISQLEEGASIWYEDVLLAANGVQGLAQIGDIYQKISSFKKINWQEDLSIIRRPWDIFTHNEAEIEADFERLTQGRQSAPIPPGVTCLGAENIFIEEGAKILPSILNAQNGKIYLGKNSEVMEGCMLRGSIALCEGAVLKMGAKVYAGTTLGPGCKAGGEIQNVVFFAHSNKGHDGYLGNSVIGEWCNLGADTNCSNLKNDYGLVQVYSEEEKTNINTGLQFCGLLMGDHSKTAINTMFNTGTVVGVNCNIFGAEFPPKFVPSFSWGGSRKTIVYQIEKALQTANNMMQRRNKSLSEAETKMMRYLYEHSPVHKRSTE